jgi:hypothetical protein
MPASGFSLSQALSALGVARVFIGDPFTVGGLKALPTEGEISVSAAQQLNRLVATELTGDVAHDAWVTPGQVTVTVPVIYTGAAQIDDLSAHGTAHEGFSGPQRPTFTSLAIIPLAEMDTSVDPPTIGYNSAAVAPATPWTPAAPANSMWFWKVVPQKPDLSMSWDNGGKIIIPVTFEVFYAGDTGKYAGIPNGQKVYTHGDPVAEGVTGLAI